MAKIVIKNIEHTTLEPNEINQLVLDIIHLHYIDWMHACGGKGRCTTCKMIVLRGIENLTEPTDFEQKMRSQGKLGKNERLACQCKLREGDIEIEVPEENQLPHVRYDY